MNNSMISTVNRRLRAGCFAAVLALVFAAIQPARAYTFIATGALNTPRYDQTAVLLLNGKVLVAKGFNGNVGNVAGSETYDPASGLWTTNGNVVDPCTDNTMTLLPNGKVLVTGGDNFVGSLTNAELFDPASGVWTETAGMTNARAWHTATLLTNGLVLVTGGYDFGSGSYPTNCELYNPATGKWANTGAMNYGRVQHTATLLANGQVLVAGGEGAGTCELYNPVSGKWSLTGSTQVPRQTFTATLLPNGQVLAAGGSSDNSSELYDPNTGLWTYSTGAMNDIRTAATATLLPNGQVLVAGGTDYSDPQNVYYSTESYNPATQLWTTNLDMISLRTQHTATLLSNGNVLMAGGYDGTNAEAATELYYAPPAPGRWMPTGSLTNTATEQTATLLTNGLVLVTGGVDTNNNALASALLYNPSTGTWAGTHPMNSPRFLHTATLLTNGLVLVAGGASSIYNQASALGSAELYNPASGTWTVTTGSLHTPRYTHTATLLPNGQVLVAGGQSTNAYPDITASAEIYNPATGLWTAANPMLIQRNSQTATLLPNGQVLIAGGQVTNTTLVTSESELFDPASGNWTQTAYMPNPLAFHTATLLPDGQVLVAGGDINEGFGFGGEDLVPISFAQLYDPVAQAWTVTTSMNFVHDHHTATLLPDGLVLIAGGGVSYGSNTNCAELYDPVGQVWIQAPSMITPRQYHTATLLTNGLVLAVGGAFFGTPLAGAELYNWVPAATIVLLHPARLNTGAFQFSWTNTPGSSNVVLSATNLITPLVNWSTNGNGVETSPGQFQFADLQATNQQRYYRVRSP